MMCLTKLAFASALVLTASAAVAQDYDTVILNGRVIDPEAKFDVASNVGIEAGKKAIVIGDNFSGIEAIVAARARGGIAAIAIIELGTAN
jgi:beta-xylosidase